MEQGLATGTYLDRPRPPNGDCDAESTVRTRLAFAVSSYTLLEQIEQEFTYHPDISVSTGFEGNEFVLDFVCDGTALTVWEIHMVVPAFDPASAVRTRTSPPGGTFVPPAA